MAKDLLHVIACVAEVPVADDDQGAARGDGAQAHHGLEDRYAGTLGAHEGPPDVEAPLGKELVEVVPRDPAGDLRKALAHRIGAALGQRLQVAVDLAPTAAGGDDRLELRRLRRSDRQAGAVVEEHVEALDIVRGAAAHQRMHATGVVADHPAERAAIVGGRVGAERQAVATGVPLEDVEDHARLHPGDARPRVELDDPVQVLRGVDDHARARRLAGQARTAAAHGDRRAVPATRLDGGDDVAGVPGEDDAERDLAEVGGVCRPRRPTAGVEANLPADCAPQRRLELGGIDHP